MVHLVSKLVAVAAMLPLSLAQASCNGSFSRISASSFVDALSPGWNIGNTLDGIPNEGDWGPVLQESVLDNAKAAGFKGIRIPVTWAYHFTTESPSWTVEPVWLDRVEEVVDWVLERDFHGLLNVHHDSWVWADLAASNANYNLIEEKFYQLWYQIGTRFGCKSSKLAFEPLNEPTGSTEEHAAELNKLNRIFLQAISDAGGFNSQRVVTLVGLGEDSIKTSQWFERPTNITNPWAIQYHYYSPYDFIFQAWGKTIWGSDADKAAMDTDMSLIRDNFTDVPLLIGEWAADPETVEKASRWKYYDALPRTAAKYNTSHMLWDWSWHYATPDWPDETAAKILQSATSGIPNALADITEDTTTLSQTSSAYLFHQAGTNITDQTLALLPNGNALQSITAVSSNTSISTLTANTHYTTSANTVIFHPTFLSTIFSPTSTPGPVANLTLHFSTGADLEIQAVVWSTPIITLGTNTTSTTPSAPATGTTDLNIPVTYHGLPQVASVRALSSDGSILEDSWTSVLGPLQAGRLTYNTHYTYDATSITLKNTLLADTTKSGQDTMLMFEFWPRTPGNVVNFTLTV